ncbi:hypothetical protein [Paenibacillus tyrfis]|uniref:Uncharacterized protein n=1 Tax=Paenibacillus tyrfis TaxID=1501230 RepID=A0A081P355_9BACL|nr:hypothetical protein [Paenibacillus tyrfis]KEQ25128.1 hypothetical protein ET33_05420 [Paenibacillus tyrfis]
MINQITVRWIMPDETYESRIADIWSFVRGLNEINNVSYKGISYHIQKVELVLEQHPWVAIIMEP